MAQRPGPQPLNADTGDSRTTQARVWDEAGQNSSVYLQRVAGLTGLRGLSAQELEGTEPCFDLLPFAEAISRNCLLVRDGDQQRMLLLLDPFDRYLRSWAMQRIKGGLRLCLLRSVRSAGLSRGT